MHIPPKLYADAPAPEFSGETNQDLANYVLDVLELANRLNDDRAELRMIVEAHTDGRK